MAKYFDVHPDNPQPRAISQVVEIIRGGGLVAYPTDSCFALGCRMGDKDGLDRIREIRHLDERHHFTLVCRDFTQLGQFATINNSLFRSIKAATPGAYTFILPATREVPRRLLHPKKKTVGYASRITRWPRRSWPSSANRWCPAPCCCPVRPSR